MLDRKSLCIMLLISTSGCAESTSIYHNRPLDTDRPRVISMDAKQRNVFMVKDAATGALGWKVCAEAAPDVFSAISASAGLDADITARKAKLAGSIAESAATLERTQTVNLLRESMYRTCERYLSGGLDKSAFIVQAARDQRSMVAVLAIEQLTRTARPPATMLAASGTSSSLANDDAVSLIKQFSQEKLDAGAAVKDADSKFVTALAKGKCDLVTDAPAADATDPALADWSACEQAKTTLAGRKKDLVDTTARLDKVIDGTQSAGQTSAGTVAGTSSTGAGSGTLSYLAIKAVAEAVRDIALSPGVDEALMFCVGYLSTPPAVTSPAVTQTCADGIAIRLNNDERLRSKVLQFSLGDQQIIGTTYVAPRADDPATPLLKAYLYNTTLSAPEKRRRAVLAGKVATAAGLIDAPADLPFLITGGDARAAALLLAELRSQETDPAGTSALSGN